MKRISLITIIGLVCNILISQNMNTMYYDKQWKEVDSLMSMNLNKSALDAIAKVYDYALTNEDYVQTIKAITYRFRNQIILVENEQPVFDSLKQDIQRLPQPAKSAGYAIIANIYRKYYTGNWRVRNRTRSAVVDNDISTWDITRLFEEALKYYRLSIQDETILQQTPLSDYRAIVDYDNRDSTRQRTVLPTLYDFLVFNAIEEFQSETSVVLPQQMFTLDKPEYFADVNAFVNYKIETPDSLSAEYNAIGLYQKLLKFRLQDNHSNPAALLSIDIERLKYVYNKGVYEDKNILYENALKSLMDACGQSSEWTYPALALAVLYAKQGNEEGNAGWKYKLKESHDLCAKIISLYDGKDEVKIIVATTKMLQTQIMQPAIKVHLENLQYPNSPILAIVHYKNTDKLRLKIYSISEEYLSDRNVSITWFDHKKPFATKEIALPVCDDYQQHSAEIMIDGLPQGVYLIYITDDRFGVFSNAIRESNVFQVSPLSVVLRPNIGNFENKSQQIYVADAKTGKPIKNAKVECFDYDNNVHTFRTDENGTALISCLNNKKIVVSNNTERLYKWHIHGSHYHDYTEKKHKTVSFFTDRSIYRPGQTVYYKALYLEKNEGKYALLKNQAIDIAFKDVNGKTIATQRHTTNEYGSVQGSFTVPQGLLNGMMRLSNEHGTQYISVEEYKRPTFEVKLDDVTENYRFNDSVRLVGRADAFAGYAVDNAQVRYDIVRTIEHRIHPWRFPLHRNPSRQIASGTVTTDDKGVFVIDFKAEADDLVDDNLIYRYKVTASVTDINGETKTADAELKIGKKPLLVWTSIPERIIARNSLDFDVGTTNLNMNFTPADLQVTITSLKSPEGVLHNRLWEVPDTFAMSREEFKKHFPLDPYGDEERPEKYVQIKQIASYAIRTVSKQDKIGLHALADAPAGWYCIDIKAKNADGIEAEYSKSIQLLGNPVGKSSQTLVPSPVRNMSNWLTVVKSSGEPGEYAEFWVGGCGMKSYIYYNLIHQNRVIEDKIIIANDVPERIVIPLKEEHRGGFAVQFLMIQNNRTYTQIHHIDVPYTNKQLDINFTSFRDKLLPGEKEKWTLNVKNKKGEKETAEMVAALYDASLDAFRPHSLFQNFYGQSFYYNEWHSYNEWSPVDFGFIPAYYDYSNFNIFACPHLISKNFDIHLIATRSQTFDFSESALSEPTVVAFASKKSEPAIVGFGSKKSSNRVASMPAEPEPAETSADNVNLTDVVTRRNFNETAFFYPQLRTDENGEISIEFTIPEALTRWKMLGFAHTEDFKIGYVANELTTQKQIAIGLNAPRFFRENDTIELTAKVNNISGNDLNGQALLRLYDAVTMQSVDEKIIRSTPTQSFSVKAGLSAGLKWTLVIPENIQAISYKVTAQAGNHTDGEEKIVPVVKNSILVTEAMPFSIRAGKQKELTFNRLKNTKSTTLRNHNLTLEFTSNPAWYAIQAMPYLMEYPYECSEQTFSRFYANSLATTVVNSSPRIRQIFEMWRNLPEYKDALLSNLEKNQELKQVLLEETPWVMQANNETERKKRVGLLFDLNRMSAEQQRAFDKVKKAQRNDGGFPWFSGCPSSYFITSHIISSFEHLGKLNALGGFKDDAKNIIDNGLQFMDKEIQENYARLLKSKVDMKQQHIGYSEIRYLYVCSFSKHKPHDTKAFDYYFAQAKHYWAEFNLYAQAMTALAMNRFGDDKTAMDIIRALKERAQRSEEMGMYWKNNVSGYFWYQATIETQALLIEAFNEIANDKQSVDDMKIWLLRNKQTNDWRTTKATAEACYALLMTGDNLLDENQTLDVTVGGKPLNEAAKEEIRPEVGTGYVKTTWTGADVNQNMATLTVANPNNSGIAWGGMYWQYFEQLDKITGAETALKMNKQLFLKTTTERGAELQPLNEKNVLRTGDIVTVRIILRADRDYEFVHLKDMRAASLEPTRAISGYRYKDGLWYYESIKDASMNFFITYLNKGTYVFEYDLRVTHAGQFSNGITTFQCMYAPEFSSHSEGGRISSEP